MKNVVKKLLSVSITLAMILSMIMPVSHAEEISGWSVSLSGGCNGNAELDDTYSNSGRNSMKIVNESPVTSNVYMRVITKVPMTEGKRYNISAQVKAESATNFYIMVEDWTKRYSLTKLGTRFDWRNFEFIYTATKTNAESVFSILAEGYTEAWIDDIKIIDMETGENLLLNSNFDGISEIESDTNAVADVADGTLEEIYNAIRRSDSFTKENIESVRGAFKYMTVYEADSITIDGISADWETYPGVAMPTLPTQYQVYIDDGRAKDVDAICKFAHDDDAFYFMIEVIDDVFVYEEGESGYWKGDSIQLAISTTDESYGSELGLAHNPTTGKGEIYGSGFVAESKARMTIATSQEGNKTVYEVKIPWKEKFEKKPEQFLFNFLVNDNDGDGRRYCAELAPGISEGKTNKVFPLLEILSGQKDWYAWLEGDRSCYTEDEIKYEYYIVNGGEEKTFSAKSEIDGREEKIVIPKNGAVRREIKTTYTEPGTYTPSVIISTEEESYTAKFDVSVIRKPPTAQYANELVSKLEKNAKELKKLIDKCEEKGISTDYELINYRVVDRFAEWVKQDIEHNEMSRIYYTEETTDDIYKQAKERLEAYLAGEKEPFEVPHYITSDAEIKGQAMYASAEYNGLIEERPTFFVGYGHFDHARNDIPVFNEFAVNTIQNEIGPSQVMKSESNWSYSNSGEGNAYGSEDVVTEGKYSMKLVYNSKLTPNKYMTLHQTVSVEPGKTYILTGKVKAQNASTVWISANDYADRNQLGGTYDWKDISVEYTAPAGKTSTVIRIIAEDITEAIYFDDLSFKEKGKEEELLIDGGFEKYNDAGAYEVNLESQSLLYMMETLEMAEENNIAVSLLISPHYFIEKVISQYGIEYTGGAFLKYNVNAPVAREIIENYLRGIIPVLAKYKSVNNIVISNEPHFLSHYLSDFYTPIWQDWLRQRYNGDIEALNREYQESFTDFSDVDMNVNADRIAHYYDYKRFNDEIFGGWHKFMAEIIKELAPDIPLNTKITGYTSSSRPTTTLIDGTGYDQYYQYLETNGCDFWNCIDDRLEPLVKEMWYDYMLSFKNVPIINSEDHVITDKSKVYTPEVADYVAQDIYQGAIHGRAMSDMWVWQRVHDPKSNLGDSVPNRPDAITKIGYAAYDLNRLAYEIEAMQLEPAEVGIIYSDANMLFNDAGMHASYEAYESVIFNGQKARFVLDVNPAAMYAYKMIIVPDVKYLTEDMLLTLKKYIENGGKVIVFGSDSFKFTEHGLEHDKAVVDYIMNNSTVAEYVGLQNGISNMTKEEFCEYVRNALIEADAYYIRVLDANTNEPAHYIEYNVGVYDGKVIINLANFDEEKKVKIFAGDKQVSDAVDLRTGEKMNGEFTVGKYRVITLETDIENLFPDTYGHWAEDNIKTLSDDGIVHGISTSRYAPERTTTRAEFLALLIRAAELDEVTYNGGLEDVDKSDWFASVAATGVANGVIENGEPLRPNDAITREEMCEMLIKCYESKAGEINIGKDIDFIDEDSISDKEIVAKAVSAGLMIGRDDGSFAPYDYTTRAEAATVIMNFLK